MWSNGMQLLESLGAILLSLGTILFEFECGDFTIS